MLTSKKSEIKILVVDDEKDIREMLVDFLKDAGYQVSEADSGSVALKAIDQFKPDLVMLDIILPDVDGVSIYEELRSKKSTTKIPVIFFTALGEGIPPTFARQMESAPYSLIPKPVNTSVLLEEVERLLKSTL